MTVPEATEPLRQRAAAPADAGAPGDLQSLVARALERLCSRTHSTRASAWSQRPDGTPFVLAARFLEGEPGLADGDALGASADLRSAASLDDPATPSALRTLASSGFSAVVPIRAEGRRDEIVALLLVGGGAEEDTGARPRTLALLDETAASLRGPAAAAHAALRLSDLDDGVQRLDRLATLGDLLAETVHEVRNPLASVKTFLGLLPDNLDDPEFTENFRQIVMEELDRLGRLLDTLAQHAAPASGGGTEARATCRPAEVLSSVARLLAQRAMERQIQLSAQGFEASQGTVEVRMDQDALRQVLLNLILNAIAATPDGGKVDLSGLSSQEWLELRIDDEGPGVDSELRTRIFEPFFSTRADRAGGLGLAISRRLTEEAGGTLEVDVAPSGGARFRVRLQLSRS